MSMRPEEARLRVLVGAVATVAFPPSKVLTPALNAGLPCKSKCVFVVRRCWRGRRAGSIGLRERTQQIDIAVESSRNVVTPIRLLRLIEAYGSLAGQLNRCGVPVPLKLRRRCCYAGSSGCQLDNAAVKFQSIAITVRAVISNVTFIKVALSV